MKNVLKSNIIRLLKDKIFWAGCCLAFIITIVFIRDAEAILSTHYCSAEYSAELISIGVIAFIAIFTPFFQGAEYTTGVIRNKVINGKSQSEIYAAHLITSFIASVIMEAAWIMGALVAGVTDIRWLMMYALRLMFSMLAYSSFMTLIGMRIRKMVTAVTLGVVQFQIAFTMNIFICMLASRTLGSSLGQVFRYMSNCLTIGRWFTASQLSDPELSINLPATAFICAAMALIFYIAGTFNINKRDLQ